MSRKCYLLVSAVIISLMVLPLTSCGNTKIERESTEKLVYEEAIDVINDQLLSPSSAVYPKFKTSFVKDIEEEKEYEGTDYHLFRVESYVEYNNAFGTLIRQKYGVIIGLPIGKENAGKSYYEIEYLGD